MSVFSQRLSPKPWANTNYFLPEEALLQWRKLLPEGRPSRQCPASPQICRRKAAASLAGLLTRHLSAGPCGGGSQGWVWEFLHQHVHVSGEEEMRWEVVMAGRERHLRF